MSDPLEIQSHKGPYRVRTGVALDACAASLLEGDPHFLIDAQVARLYDTPLKDILNHPCTLRIEATEDNKSLDQIIPVLNRLVDSKVRRGQPLVAIGGGIIQDITCFIASTMLRGLPWRFAPTTLLAQADSCIGSKSSINLGDTKNILGTFNPPEDILICPDFLDTLEHKDIQSGVGEILKVHAIDGLESFNRLAADFDRLFSDRAVLQHYIRSALLIKKCYIEEDEFDRGTRNIFNYGHSFGHAMESATHYAIPHGIAVTLGMDMANHIAVQRGLLPKAHYERMHPVLFKNYRDFSDVAIPVDDLLSALMKDKKNTATMLGLIFPTGPEAKIQRLQVPPDADFRDQCAKFLAELGK